MQFFLLYKKVLFASRVVSCLRHVSCDSDFERKKNEKLLSQCQVCMFNLVIVPTIWKMGSNFVFGCFSFFHAKSGTT